MQEAYATELLAIARSRNRASLARFHAPASNGQKRYLSDLPNPPLLSPMLSSSSSTSKLTFDILVLARRSPRLDRALLCQRRSQTPYACAGHEESMTEQSMRQHLGIPDDAERVIVFAESSHWDPNWLHTSEESGSSPRAVS